MALCTVCGHVRVRLPPLNQSFGTLLSSRFRFTPLCDAKDTVAVLLQLGQVGVVPKTMPVCSAPSLRYPFFSICCSHFPSWVKPASLLYTDTARSSPIDCRQQPTRAPLYTLSLLCTLRRQRVLPRSMPVAAHLHLRSFQRDPPSYHTRALKCPIVILQTVCSH